MRAAALVAGLVVALPPGAAAAPGAAPLDPARVGWTAVEFAGTKFFLSATSRIVLQPLTAEDVGARLLVPPQGVPVEPGPIVLEMRYGATLGGQRTGMTLLLDPLTGSALQLVLRDSGRRVRQRTWRFTDRGGYQWTRRPAGDAEEDRPPAAWTDTSEGLRPWDAPTAGRPVTDATALLYVLAAAPLAAAGDRYEILEFSRRHLHRVTAEVLGTTRVAVDYIERGTATRHVRADVPALRIRLRGASPVGGSAAPDDFTLLGLTGGIEVAVDPANRLPLEVSGSAPYVGHVVLRVKAATLR